MTLVSNDPSWWPVINGNIIFSYLIVTASTGLIYDWALTFGQEVELIWRQRWSLMTFLYLSVRYVGIGRVVGLIINDGFTWMGDAVNVLLGVIMIARLHAMYQRSRKVLMFLVVIFLAIRIANAGMLAITMMQISGEEFVLSGTYQCMFDYAGDSVFLTFMAWMLDTVWEVLALCLAIWIAVKHFRELRQHSTRGIIGDCFMVLMKSHVIYFVSFLAISCFQIGLFSPTVLAIFEFVGLFVLGPRLILGVREHYAELVANSDMATAMTSIAFQEFLSWYLFMTSEKYSTTQVVPVDSFGIPVHPSCSRITH
ncbi:hypothetical protein DFJ58DRAFT_847654 [Suillus subalutaceus]|uniref:uncharacterized protein n=1 Tax=Suillus subalutaceus TaxID=48586 RepID=UPI001B86C76F|nr:uncharacterized protein DFJ58DRAFT_847654 [Suillus subalutaceus]KAG1834296.1 hypothetical protein DFJ58DRAFT_847654 [Suillus subalutaceus]